MAQRFRDSRNRFITNGLFAETATGDKEFVIMGIDDARKLFIACGDPLGYEFAEKHLESYDHWKELKASSVLGPIIAKWEEELEIKLRSDALKRILRISEEGHFQANKLLLDGEWKEKKAGRPPKEEVERQTRIMAKVRDEYKADVVRIKRD